jgi:DNA repair protein SbcC/Rad50
MKFFRKLIIENFQSHHYTEIDFVQGVNVFVGPSDSGKSAILRALRWLLFNIPRGTEFIRAGTKECHVTLLLQDGTKIVRIRGVSVNRYLLHTTDGQAQVFEGFGSTVPQEITSTHDMQAILLDQKEIFLHFGTQLESPFLLCESDRTKAKMIGRISGAQLIDQALQKTNHDRQSAHHEVKQLEQQVRRSQERLQQYENLARLEERLTQAEKMYEEISMKKKQVEALSRYQRELEAVHAKKELLLTEIHKLTHLPQAERLLCELEKKRNRYQQLLRCCERGCKITAEKERWQSIVDRSTSLPLADQCIATIETKTLHFRQLLPLHLKWKQQKQQKEHVQDMIQRLVHLPVLGEIVQRVEEKAIHLKSFTQFAKQWSDVRGRIEAGKQFYQEKNREIADLTGEWAQLLQAMEKCPTCGSPIQRSMVEYIIAEYRGV